MQTKKQGYTLLELLVVIGIIGVLTAVSAPGVADFSTRIAFQGVVDNFENSFRENFSLARSGSFYPLIFVRKDGEGSTVEICQEVFPDPKSEEFTVYQMIDGKYFCDSSTYENFDMKNVFFSETRYTGEDLNTGDTISDFQKIGIQYMPPYGDLRVYTQDKGKALAYPAEASSESVKSIAFTLSNGIDFETIKLWQTGLIERFKGKLNDA